MDSYVVDYRSGSRDVLDADSPAAASTEGEAVARRLGYSGQDVEVVAVREFAGLARSGPGFPAAGARYAVLCYGRVEDTTVPPVHHARDGWPNLS